MARGSDWTFDDFCRVYCNPSVEAAKLGADLGRTAGAIDAVRASIDAKTSGKASPTFPGAKWETFVTDAVAGKCRCGADRGTGGQPRSGCAALLGFGRRP